MSQGESSGRGPTPDKRENSQERGPVAEKIAQLKKYIAKLFESREATRARIAAELADSQMDPVARTKAAEHLTKLDRRHAINVKTIAFLLAGLTGAYGLDLGNKPVEKPPIKAPLRKLETCNTNVGEIVFSNPRPETAAPTAKPAENNIRPADTAEADKNERDREIQERLRTTQAEEEAIEPEIIRIGQEMARMFASGASVKEVSNYWSKIYKDYERINHHYADRLREHMENAARTFIGDQNENIKNAAGKLLEALAMSPTAANNADELLGDALHGYAVADDSENMNRLLKNAITSSNEDQLLGATAIAEYNLEHIKAVYEQADTDEMAAHVLNFYIERIKDDIKWYSQSYPEKMAALREILERLERNR